MAGLLRRADLASRLATGILLDLGVSSHQIDQPGRGFAFSADGPLDMRMGETGETAADLVRRLSPDALADVIYQYGEERRSRGIAKAIKAAAPTTTAELADAVRQSVPGRDEMKSLARVFQALRIAVNGELDVLEAVLPAALDALAVGGRLAVMSYHSLEDRRAKQFLKTGRFSNQVEKDFFGNPITPWRAVTRRAVVAGDAETSAEHARPQRPAARRRKTPRAPRATPDGVSGPCGLRPARPLPLLGLALFLLPPRPCRLLPRPSPKRRPRLAVRLPRRPRPKRPGVERRGPARLGRPCPKRRPRSARR